LSFKLYLTSPHLTAAALQMPALREHGLEFVDPFEKMKMKDKSLQDMGSENFDLSALPFAHFCLHLACSENALQMLSF
jgi:hypothetical protein